MMATKAIMRRLVRNKWRILSFLSGGFAHHRDVPVAEPKPISALGPLTGMIQAPAGYPSVA